MAIDPERVGSTFDVDDYAVTAEAIAAYAEATEDPLPAYRGEHPIAPPVFAIVPVWSGIEHALADPRLELEVTRIVHGEQHFRFHRSIRAGDVLSSTGELTSLTEKGDNEIFVLTFRTTDADGAPVVDQDVVCVSRGTASGAGHTATSDGPRAAGVPAPAPEDVGEPDVVRRVHLPEDITYRYADASGDHNAIHVDPDAAVNAGLPGIIVHGLCMLAIALQGVVEEIADGDPDGLAEVGARFSRPVQPGNDFATRIWRVERGARFESAEPDGKPALRDGNVILRAAR